LRTLSLKPKRLTTRPPLNVLAASSRKDELTSSQAIDPEDDDESSSSLSTPSEFDDETASGLLSEGDDPPEVKVVQGMPTTHQGF
jgi:hypothetical protein